MKTLRQTDRETIMNGVFVLLIAVQLIQILVYCHWKDGLYLDELFSYGLANGMNLPFLNYLEGFGAQWFSSDVIRQYLTVQAGEFSLSNVYTNQSLDVHPPLYYWLLHSICALFPNVFSPWFGYVLNLVCFVISSIYLYKISKRAIHNDIVALLPNVLFGFGAAVAITIYIRMYALMTVFSLMMVYALIKIKDEPFSYKNNIAYFMAILLGCYTQYYFIIFAFFLTAFFSVLFLLQKEWKKLTFFCASALLAVLSFFVTWPHIFEHLLGGGFTGKSKISDLTEFTSLIGAIRECAYKMLGLIFKGKMIGLGVSVALLLLCFVAGYQYKKGKMKSWRSIYQKNKKEVDLFAFLALAVGCTFVLIAYVADFKLVRYFYFLSPFLILFFVVFVNCLLSFLFKKRNVLMSVVLVACVSLFIVLDTETFLVSKYNYNLRENQLEQFTDQYAVVVVSSDIDSTVTQCALELMQSSSFYILYQDELDTFQEVLQIVDEPDELVVYLSQYCDDEDEVFLALLCAEGSFKNVNLMEESSVGNIYLLSK